MHVPLFGGNGYWGGQDHCCFVHICREVMRDLPPPGLLSHVLTREGFFLEPSCIWITAAQPVEKNAPSPLSGNVMSGLLCLSNNQCFCWSPRWRQTNVLFPFSQVIVSGYRMRLRDLCNGSTSPQFLTIQNQTASMDSEAFICNLSKEKLRATEQAFRANLNPLKPLQVSLLAVPVRICCWQSDIFKSLSLGAHPHISRAD